MEHKKTKGRVKVLRASLYKEHKIIIRMIGDDYFEYITEYNGEIYSSYIIITPQENKKKLSKKEIEECRDLIYAGGEATIDALLGEIDDREEVKKIVEMVEGKENKCLKKKKPQKKK